MPGDQAGGCGTADIVSEGDEVFLLFVRQNLHQGLHKDVLLYLDSSAAPQGGGRYCFCLRSLGFVGNYDCSSRFV